MKHLLLATTAAVAVSVAAPAFADPTIGYVPGSLAQSKITTGPWTLHESVFKRDASGIVPTASGPPYAGSGVPYRGICMQSGVFATNVGTSVMQPFYFPFVRRNGSVIEGFFDYRPRNQQEATVAAVSSDWGKTWQFTGMALALNPYCPWDATDPDNLYVSVGGVQTRYGIDATNAADNGLGHPVVLNVNGNQYIYHLNRATNHIDSDQLVVHPLPVATPGSLAGLPAYGYQSPLAPVYPALDSTATATTGLINPDAFMGSVPLPGGITAGVYVEKTLNGDTSYPSAQKCPSTPAYALTNFVNGKARKRNDDVTVVRIATTTDGINFTDVGPATGLNDPTTVALNGIRYLGSGSILPLSNGHYGMFFGAGNCLDNDSDGFHFIGYAETVNVVSQASDLLAWRVIYGFDNPILSTDTVINPVGPRPYPLSAPVVNVTGADALTAAQVAPFVPAVAPTGYLTPTGGYNSNFFSGRVYDPQALYTDSSTVTIVFAGYNTPQPSNNLGDYRTIGRFQLQFPAGYVAPF
ncbi:MAG: hypothetical protein P4M07_14045 [Xanthobacteraceae bacterium]|nr:hypothetical protein [Xanthobacteraceae bacterium]